MKAYTDIEQSKMLAEILPIESADMAWYSSYAKDGYSIRMLNDTYPLDIKGDEHDEIPAWSLAALVDVLPEHVIMPYYAPYLQKEDGKYHVAYGNDELLCEADNPIDAAVEMILKLREKDLLQC